MRSLFAATLVFLTTAGAAFAEFAIVKDRPSFVQLISGKTLSRPLVTLNVSPEGSISGKGASRPVTGQWVWRQGYFCRDLTWGKRDLGYNCQEVRVNGSSIRFRSDKGSGDYADFRLR